VVQNTHELGGALHEYATRLRADPAMLARFARSFGLAGDSTVTPVRVAQALAAYERTLIALDAPFDRYLRGDTAAMTPAARRGYSVFMGSGKCGTCHFAPLFNGTVPPVFARSEVEVIGTPATRGWRHATLDSDSGRARLYASPGYLRAFKTPTLRNVAVTGPYMHNGVYRTLDDVVEFYARGGGAGLGLNVPNQTLPFDTLQLSARDKRDLVAFLHALTDARYSRVVVTNRTNGGGVGR
jgi:cytochrome c peroxidase